MKLGGLGLKIQIFLFAMAWPSKRVSEIASCLKMLDDYAATMFDEMAL
jgi:hypothetical protein